MIEKQLGLESELRFFFDLLIFVGLGLKGVMNECERRVDREDENELIRDVTVNADVKGGLSCAL